ncbi:phosphatase PAP2 family protein [Dietzia maris]|uniref:phosphatase PAP2 family protein n=1 Tax=Dietzia maris TaxID=37915 RepID=UPI00232FCC90|nr:phosphatase PAP2 family protein [Dietzia maris]
MTTDDGDARRSRGAATWGAVAAGAGMLGVLLLVFVGLASAVADDGHVPLDRPVMMWVHGATTPWLTAAAETASYLGGQFVLAASAVIALLLCVLRRFGGAVLVLAAVYGSSRLNVALKPAFERSRPDLWEHLSVENTFSFPSGHAMGSMSLAAPLVVLAWGTRYRWASLAVAVVYVLAVGASRVYLGVHFPSDVLAGWCLTVLWVGILTVILLLVTGVLRRYAPTLAEWV